MAKLIVAAGMVLAALLPTAALADENTDSKPESEGFAHIDQVLGHDKVGDVAGPERPSDDGDGTVQPTRKADGTWGLLRWQASTNETTYTDGDNTYDLAQLLSWAQHVPIRPNAESGGSTGGPGDGVWRAVASCESQGEWSINTGNGYLGGLQITQGNWIHYGGTAYAPSPAAASPSAQETIANKILADQGWRAWPACSARLGLR